MNELSFSFPKDYLFEKINHLSCHEKPSSFPSRPRAMNRNMSTIFSVAAGVGLIAGTTGVLLYHYLFGRPYILVLEQNINLLESSLANLRFEFEELQDSHRRKRRKRSPKRSKIGAGSTASFTDASMYSALESDLDDEFCDISNSDDDTMLTTQSFMSYTTAMSSTSGSVINEFSNIDTLLEGTDDEKEKALQLLQEMYSNKSSDCEVLWRLARALHAVGSLEGAKGDMKKKQLLITEGIEYAQKALDADQNSANAHKWYAICVGARGQFSSTKEKIKDGVTFKEHIEQAIKIDNSDPSLYNLLGRFEFEVSQLSSMERRVASWLFAEVPVGTVENAIAGFEKTEQLKPEPWKENRLLLAKCYVAQKKYDIAVHWLDKALEVVPVNSEEKSFDEEIKKLLKKYESHRKS